MTRWRSWLLALAVALLLAPGPTVRPALAQSLPVIAGDIAGEEFCLQLICGGAISVGQFQGEVGGDKAARGTWVVQVTHQAVSTEVGATASITGGDWQLVTSGPFFGEGVLVIRGSVEGGTMTYRGDDRYEIEATLRVQRGGSGALKYSGVLDHRPLHQDPPRGPRITGTLAQ